MNDKLPQGWAHCPVEKVFRSFGGGTPNKGTPAYWRGSIPWLSSGDIKTERIHSATEFITRAGLENSSANICRPGSVLVVVRSGVLKHTLPVAIVEREAAINQDIKCFDSGCSELNEWLSLALRASANDILALNREGTTVQSVKYETLKEFHLSIPPFAEQKRIVAKLEKLLGHVEACQQRLARIPTLLKRFRQAVLAAACSGRLTADWREENQFPADEGTKAPDDAPEVPESWGWRRLSDVANVKGGVTKGRKLTRKKTIMLPYLRVANVQDGYLDLSEMKQIEVLPEDKGKYHLEAGDLLFTEGGDRDKLGRGTIWRGEIPECIHQNHIFRARLHSKEFSPDYVSIASKSEFSRRYFFENANQTVNLASINLTTLSALPIPLPPLREQEEIARRVSSLFDVASRIEARFAEGRRRVDSISQALLAKAFRGELVPTEFELAKAEGRSFESAEELLKRIRGNGQIIQAETKPSRKK